MKFARLIERNNRQVLLTVGFSDEHARWCVQLETHYKGGLILSVTTAGFSSYSDAYTYITMDSDEDIFLLAVKLVEEYANSREN